jgi:hypothetical protein
MFDIDWLIIKALYLKSNIHFQQYLCFNSRDVPGSPNLIFQTQGVGNYQLHSRCLYNSLMTAAPAFCGKGKGKTLFKKV